MTQATFLPTRPKGALLKWVGNKFRYAPRIVSYFPDEYGRFIEPFVGTGAVIGTVAPIKGLASDTLKPLIDIWKWLQDEPTQLTDYYSETIRRFNHRREEVYKETVKAYNTNPNGLDLLIISRTCYGGVVRFTRQGTISTPIGPHKPIAPETFAERTNEWRERIRNTRFIHQSFDKTLDMAEEGDLVYCDPPYQDTQSILYGAQSFDFNELVGCIQKCKKNGVKVALSIDGKKKSGKKNIELEIPSGLFRREIYVDCGSSMLKRFQNGGSSMIGEDVHERLLLTW